MRLKQRIEALILGYLGKYEESGQFSDYIDKKTGLGKPSKKKNKKCGFFPHWGGGGVSWKECFLRFLRIFARFLPFLTAKFPEIFHTLGEGGLEGVIKMQKNLLNLNFYFSNSISTKSLLPNIFSRKLKPTKFEKFKKALKYKTCLPHWRIV